MSKKKKKVFIANSHHTKVQLLLCANLFSFGIYLTAFIEGSMNNKDTCCLWYAQFLEDY